LIDLHGIGEATLSVEVFHAREETVSLVGACPAYRETVIVPGRHPHLAAQGLDRFTADIPSHLIVSHHDMGVLVGVTVTGASLRTTQCR
jgi:hypothetical protein